MKKISLIFLLVFATSPLFSQTIFSLEECIEYAMTNNLTIKKARFDELFSEETHRQSKYELVPNLNAQANQNFNTGKNVNPQTNIYVDQHMNTTNVYLGSQVTLFSGLQKINTIKQNKFALMAKQNNVEKVRQDISLDILSEYLNILYNKELIINYEEQLEISKKQVVDAISKKNIGTITDGDLLQFESQVATDELNLTTAQNQLDNSIIKMRQLLNLKPNEVFDILPPSEYALSIIKTNYTADSVYNEALLVNYDLKTLTYEIYAQEKAVKISKGKYMPTLLFGASVSSSYSSVAKLNYPTVTQGPTNFYIPNVGNVWGPQVSYQSQSISFADQMSNNLGTVYGFTLQVPIFNSFQVRSRVRKDEITLEEIRNEEEITKNNLQKTISEAVSDLKSAEKTLIASEKKYNSLKKTYEYNQKRFDVGLLKSLDLSIAKANYSKSESDALQAKYDLIFKSKIIDYYLGKPLTL